MRRRAASSQYHDVHLASFAYSKSDNTCAIASIVARLAVAIRAALFALLLGAAWPVAAQTTGSAKFIPTFLIYYGGGPALVATHAPTLAKFYLIDVDHFRYNNTSPSPWAASKAYNPNVQI